MPGEASLQRGVHQPYLRVEYASRPEFTRDGSRVTAGYGARLTALPYSVRPFVEGQWQFVSTARGPVTPESLYERSSFGSISAGFRVFLGGEPMRMSVYGVLHPMTMMHAWI